VTELDDPQLLDLLADGVLVADADGVVVRGNSAAVRLLEVDSARIPGARLGDVMALQNLDGQDWLDCVKPYGGIRTRRELLESSWRTTSGREVLVTGRLHRDRPGGAVRLVALAVRDARSRQFVDRERSDLVATVAHELRSPLTGVKGFTSTLLANWDRFSDSQRLLMLKTVDADADRLTRLIVELLDVARIDSGRLTVRKEPVDVAASVAAQLETLSASNGRTITLLPVARPRIWVDKDKLAQIVANLVENAVEHGDGDVWVSVNSTPDGGVELVVDDEGLGIPAAIRPRVFTKFWKHGHAGGSGLGLYIVGGLVAAHHGTVQVESSPAGGARMRVTLPEGRPAALL
jgi:signal transduction histidine kinase